MPWLRKQPRQKQPLARAFSHKDSGQARPLFDALDNGFASFEMDVWLVDGELLVGHDFNDLNPDRTLESLYLKPLLEHVRRNKGTVYPAWMHSVQLLIDIKTAPEPAYNAVHELLERYKEILTTTVNGVVRESAVTAVISGERPLELMEAQNVRYAAYDGRLPDLGNGYPASLIPVISDEWPDHFQWQGNGEMPEEERAKLHDIVKTAHANGQRCRFWATPDDDPFAREAVWKELVAAKVDYINTDHITALHEWLRANDPQPSVPEIVWFAKRNAANTLNILKKRRPAI